MYAKIHQLASELWTRLSRWNYVQRGGNDADIYQKGIFVGGIK